jgi:two-component system CheB/CheR fusion protein
VSAEQEGPAGAAADQTAPEAASGPCAFPVVAIGASAGGLEPLCILIEAMPRHCGMAFLVIQHLDPTRPSLLTDILAKRTDMPVAEAIDGDAVQVDHIYVIPPNTSMSIRRGHLHLSARSDALGPPTPIDDIFQSLASDQGSNGIGIVLSGQGSDGAIGLQTLHNVGAVTFAQDDASAKYTSMPRAVRGLGCVDLVLPPHAIAAELLRIAAHPYFPVGCSHGGMPDLQIAETDLQQVFSFLKRDCNIDFGNYKRGTIYRRVARRLALRDIASIADYLAVLDTEPEEIHALCNDLLIRFTEFFRDPEVYQALLATALSRFANIKGVDEPIRIWVPGCASGEEVYSIAITMMEYLSSQSIHRPLQIFGTDVSEEALETARAGRYIENIARNISPERLERFFVREDDYYRVTRSVRDCCTFARQNVVFDPPFSRMDLISCRNLMIYLDPSLQRRVIPLLHYALKPHGVLLLGMSESAGTGAEFFTPIGGQKYKIYAKNDHPGRTMPVPVTNFPASAQRSNKPSAPTAPNAEELFRKQIDAITLEAYAPPCVLCTEDMNVVEFRGDTSAFLINRSGAPTTQLRSLMRPGLVVAVSEAVLEAMRDERPARRENLRVDTTAGMQRAHIQVVPVPPGQSKTRWMLVFFELAGAAGLAASPVQGGIWHAIQAWRPAGRQQAEAAATLEVARLSNELGATRNHITVILKEHEVAVQELKSSEEEMLSSNEEIQSTNEELETAKEELQSLNEELSTTNDELAYRNRELRAMHDKMTVSRDYAEAIVETMSDPMLILESDGRVVRANHAFYSCFKVDEDEVLGTSLFSLGAGQWDTPALRRALRSLSALRTRVNDYEVSRLFPVIGYRSMRLNAVHLLWDDNPMILLTIQDVTERRKDLDRLRTTDRQKDEFLAMLGHELRNPLAAMANALMLWKVGTRDEHTQKFIMSVFERQVANQTRLVEDLLDVSRITRGVVALRLKKFDLVETVRDVLATLAPQTGDKQLTVQFAAPPARLCIEGDPMRLEQVCNNLIGNAVKYTQAGGKITVTLVRAGDEAVLTVEDNGVGIDASVLPAIFDVFVQADMATDRHLGGLGIGLALVHRLVELHGGSVTAASAGLAQGSTFVMRVPALPADVQVPDYERLQSRYSPQPPGRRILLVDDNTDALESCTRLLRMAGNTVASAIDGPSALDIAQSFLPELVLLDIGLPGIDGYEVCRQMRAMPALRDTVMVAHSGYGQPCDRQKSRDAGFDHHLIKPCDLSVVATLARVPAVGS